MNAFDIVILIVAVMAAVGGYRLGFLARALSWVGLGIGLWIGAVIVPHAITGMDLSSSGQRLLVAAAILIGAAFIGQVLGLIVGSKIHSLLPLGPLRSVDRGVGAAIGIIGVIAALWLILPAMSSVAGWPARATRGSAISRWVSNNLARPPNTIESLRRYVGQDAEPEVFNRLHQGGAAGTPPATSSLSQATTNAVAASTVKVTGQACNQIQDGSGWAVGNDLVVTNAHVVAGEPSGQTDVIVPSGKEDPATVVAFDPNRDIALLSVPGLDETPLPLATGKQGDLGAVFGHPGGQSALAVTPAQISQEVTAQGYDLYDRHQTSRDVFVLASNLKQGDSGGALVNGSGQVIGIAFAIAPDSPGTSYALSTSELRPVLSARSAHAVSTEDCLLDD